MIQHDQLRKESQLRRKAREAQRIIEESSSCDGVEGKESGMETAIKNLSFQASSPMEKEANPPGSAIDFRAGSSVIVGSETLDSAA